MNYEILIAIGFCLFILLTCRLWGIYVVKQYEKNKLAKSRRELKPEYYSCEIGELTLAGTGDDGNSDYEFSHAAAKIKVSEQTRVQIYDKTRIY